MSNLEKIKLREVLLSCLKKVIYRGCVSTHQREKQVFIPLELCLADYLQNLVPSCPSQNKHNLHSEQDRLQVQWSYFGLSDQKMIYTEMRRADLGSRHGNWFRVLNKERRENMTHCSWCNPQGPEKLYFKPYLKKRIFMEGEKEAAFSPQGRLYRCCHIPPRCLLESKATSIPLEILLALPSKYIQNLGSSSGKRNIRPTIKLGSTSRNEEHWKWNQASIVHFHLSDCENQTQNHFTGSGPWLLISTLEPRTKWEENDSEFLGAIPSHLCKSQSLRHSPSGVSRTIFHQDFPTQAVPRLGNYQEVTRTSASRGITPDSAPSLSSEPSAL
ncbi:uncharacterized protein LOC123379195 isoform X3 [Felis catus]|uniref:uncharacterized protein LOC123379195 isoform X3 n=1 Tax=Felis catus TaxID=9685 RepID=UPI001D19D19F|nr:uncharacterized protein LOC123379195 isoform X3 [Felis catus]